jgi:Rieske Fe-S protein
MTNPTSSHPPAAAAEPAAPGLSRRAVVAGVGGVAAAGLLTACGGGSTPAAPAAPATTAAAEPAPAAPSASAGASGAGGTELTATSAVPVGGGTVFADRDVVVTQPTAGDFKAFSATCTHQGCKVKSVADGVIVCPCHGSKFAIADGAVTAGPAKSPLPEKTISVEGDSILLT